MYSLTEAVLEKFDNPHDFERMCADILNALGYQNVVPIAPRGGSDGGKDITFTTENGGRGLACVTLRNDIDNKFREDFTQRHLGEYDKYMLFCNSYLTAQQKQKFEEYCSKTLKAEFIPRDLEAIRSLLDSSLQTIRQQYIEKYARVQTSYVLDEPPEETLYDLLTLCTVHITVSGAGKHGTGFFIAPEQILTSLEVVKNIYHAFGNNCPESLTVHWNGYGYAARLVQITPTFVECGLALIELHIGKGPCVFLHEDARPSDFLYSYGYPDDFLSGASSTFECEGKTRLHKDFIKFKAGHVSSSILGSPLLNLRTGKVCGIIAHARDNGNADGGIAIPAKTIFECLPDLKNIQQQYHQENTRWLNSLNRT
ncbi:hypothetical protein KSC_044710 [Ktedonobacter sp. SOSP1-52]|uniref:restriction endonuclease n=1 Tax=Ktedonobacter sp. SOSP1-52 TaxID=2778366 RepID=UPI0019163A41|nr:restriction endonuclease [Ktedonobacter sp. SOSP1-52]GHO65579.1 hypothetical protein KSC_044710 [Ktedonobacter sp. SOSP1-52]